MFFQKKIDYQQVMTEFLLGVKQACLEDPNPHFADFRYKSFEELLLEKGQFFKKGKANQVGIEGYCFSCCQQYLLEFDNPNLYYCEGYAIAGKNHYIPTRHGWLLENGKVLDITARGLSLAYYGINLNWEEIAAIRYTRQQIGEGDKSEIFDYESIIGLQLLKEGELILA
jgi:hypothetical protein